MVWILILTVLLLILCWLLFSPLEFLLDTRTPRACLRWITIGKAAVFYEEEKWLLKISVLFFSWQWELDKIILEKKKQIRKSKPSNQSKNPNWYRKLPAVVKTFRITKWQLAIDTGDYIQNAWLYPLNSFSFTRHHLFINFSEENYLLLVVRNAPWRLVYAFMR